MNMEKIENDTKTRMDIDWSKHELTIKKDQYSTIYILKIPGSSMYSCYFINCMGVLSVTGDLGNWIFCREFHPGPKEGVSDGYWKEKLKISSCQEPSRYDPERTEKEIREMLEEDDLTEEHREFLNECLERVDDELEYTYFAFREYPNDWDLEYTPFVKTASSQLLAVYDAFDEICRRMGDDAMLKERTK